MIDLRVCNELADSLSSEIKTMQLVNENDNKIIDWQDLQIFNLQKQNKEQKIISDLSDKQLKRSNIKNRTLKIELWSVAVAGITSMGYFIIK